MRIEIIGAGGEGGFYAAQLKRSGNDVSVLARGEHLERIREVGLRVITPISDFTIRMDEASDNVASLGKCDLAIVTLKSWQIDGIIDSLDSLLGSETVILPIQNGVEAYPTLSRAYPDNAIGGLTRIIAYVEKPGTVRQLGNEVYVAIGRSIRKEDPRLKKLKETLDAAGLKCEISQDIDRDLWDKFLMMATLGGVGSITQAPIGVLRKIPETREMLASSMEEVKRVANAHGITLDNHSTDKAWKFIDSVPFETTSSMQRDVGSGKASELSYLSGAVVRLGSEKGVPTPLHSMILAALLPTEMRARGELRY